MSLLECNRIAKSFIGTRALDGVSFRIDAGEIVGLIGENGAGKSTLIKVLCGVHQPDDGEIIWRGETARFTTPHAALEAGIATIHQELAYFEKLTVAENLLMGQRWPRTRWGGVDWRRLNDLAAEQLESCGLEINPRALCHTLSPAQRQELAIARALSQNARLVVLDEPTASLTEPEVVRLITHLARLKQSGVGILYVSHRLDEILKLADRVLVLRDGALVAQYPTKEANIERMVRDMVGRELSLVTRRETAAPGAVVFQARGLTRLPFYENIHLEVRAGEIVGLAGLVGAGRSELARAIFGLYGSDRGDMKLNGLSFRPTGAAAAKAHGVAYLPEERKRQGLVLDHSLRSAISIGSIESDGRFGWIQGSREKSRVEGAINTYRIKAQSSSQPVGTLSGGNQQKAMLARCLESDPKLIILDEPTRGVDVGAKAEIHGLIGKTATRGKAVLLISSDLPELLALSDKIVVLHRGRIAAQLPGPEATQEEILLAASGFAKSTHS